MNENNELLLKTIEEIQKEEIKIQHSKLTDYKIENHLQSGKYGSVSKAIQIKTGKTVAIKSIPIKHAICAKNEIKANIKLGKNRYITEMIDYFNDDKNDYLVFEYTSHGDLVDFLNKHEDKYFKKMHETKKIIRDVCKGLLYCHSKNICHRDIKPDNVLVFYDVARKEKYYKLSDLGLSDFSLEKISLTSGTLIYAAPELKIENPLYFCNETDMWAVGIMTYYVYFFETPFKIEEDDEGYETEYLDLTEAYDVDKEMFNFISKLTDEKPEKRLTAEQALNHPFLKEEVKLPVYREQPLFTK